MSQTGETEEGQPLAPRVLPPFGEWHKAPQGKLYLNQMNVITMKSGTRMLHDQAM